MKMLLLELEARYLEAAHYGLCDQVAGKFDTCARRATYLEYLADAAIGGSPIVEILEGISF
jgi:hypothetical protein